MSSRLDPNLILVILPEFLAIRRVLKLKLKKMKLFTILKTEKGEDKAQIAGQIRDGKSIPELSQIVKAVTGEKPGTAVRTENTVTFNTPSYKVDFVDKKVLIGGQESTGGKIED